MEKINGDTLRGHLDAMVLAALSTSEAHGYEIMRRLEGRGCGMLELKEGTLYPALYRLEEAGHIRGRWEDKPPGIRGPRRRTYRLTSKGRRQLVQQQEKWREFVRVVGQLMGAEPCVS
ncbi:MAG TPA: helix-turn-helix transcriptional regulator [Candidatus Brocadiia bacterium]|nr:helix-turn-helix transcriptional regulator [Candidatus Brocadiia bacterium]